MIESLPHVNASLNCLAAALLIIGFVLIKNGNEAAHKRAMMSAFVVSTLFMASYLTYHWNVGSRKFPSDDYAPLFYAVYLAVLATHAVLAIIVPFLAAVTIFLGLTDRRQTHRKLARWTFPIWLYVSVTGVLVYFMLYWWFLPVDS